MPCPGVVRHETVGLDWAALPPRGGIIPSFECFTSRTLALPEALAKRRRGNSKKATIWKTDALYLRSWAEMLLQPPAQLGYQRCCVGVEVWRMKKSSTSHHDEDPGPCQGRCPTLSGAVNGTMYQEIWG
jgi:hypothetical protein